jgi:hypothetical protein
MIWTMTYECCKTTLTTGKYKAKENQGWKNRTLFKMAAIMVNHL